MAQYLMQARDSVAGTMHRWLASSADFAGAGYPGPNSPDEIAVVASAGDVSNNDGFSIKHVATLSGIADSGDDSTAATLGSDGIYLFTVIATAAGSGGSYLVAYKVRGQLSSGTLTLGTPVPIEDDDTGDIDLSFADDSGALEVTVSNTSGATVNARVAVGWLFCPVPAAPVTYVDSPQLIGTGTAPPTVTLSGDYAHLTGLRVRVVFWSFPILSVDISLDGGDTWEGLNYQEFTTLPWTVEIPGAPGAFLTFPRDVAYSDDNFYEVSVSTA
jgi:hypothetical protein